MESSVPPPLRNRSLAAGRTEPDLANRSPRPRLRSIRWVREPLDAPDVYPLGPGDTRRPPLHPPVPSRLGVQVLDRARQRVQTGMFIYKEPDVVLSLVNDHAVNYMRGLTFGDYFAVWIVTQHMEKAIAVFTLEGKHDVELHLDDKGQHGLAMGDGDFAPLVIVEDGAIQDHSVKGEHIPEVHLSDQAAQGATLTDGQAQAQVSMTDKAQSAHTIANSDFRPMVFLEDSASSLVSTADGEHFLELRVQTMLEKAVASILLDRGAHDVPIFEVIVNDKGYLTVRTQTSSYIFYYPLDNLETYTNGETLTSKNDGRYWAGPYVDRSNRFGIQMHDSAEFYSDGVAVNGLNLGAWTGGPYVDRVNHFGIKASDNAESYSDAALLNALNGGSGFAGAYVDRNNFRYVYDWDKMETYADLALVDGLNGGDGFAGPYVDRTNTLPRDTDLEDFASYNLQDPVVDSLNGGPLGWSGPWVFSSVYLNFVGEEPFEAYALEDPIVSSLNSGTGFSGAWVFSPIEYPQFKGEETFESYALEDPLLAVLNAGTNWNTPWAYGPVLANGFTFKTGGATDLFHDYTDQNPIVGVLNSGGGGWAAAWLIGGAVLVESYDNFETYADENPIVSTLNAGTGWSGAWLTP